MRLWLMTSGLIALSGMASAQEAVKLSGTLRLRYEAIEGQLRTGFNRDDDLFSVRTTLHAEYAPTRFTS